MNYDVTLDDKGFESDLEKTVKADERSLTDNLAKLAIDVFAYPFTRKNPGRIFLAESTIYAIGVGVKTQSIGWALGTYIFTYIGRGLITAAIYESLMNDSEGYEPTDFYPV